MAGAGRRTFTPGEVLTASNVMNYLQDQAVMNFAGTAARGSAIGTAVAEGMVSYLADTNPIEVYDGSAWKQISATTGNILQVVSSSYNTTVTTTSSSYVTSNLSATITPKSSTSKIFLVCSSVFQFSSGGLRVNSTIFRGGLAGTNLNSPYAFSTAYQANGETVLPFSITYLDSPATTSATSYTLAFNVSGGTGYIHASGTKSSLTLIEVAA
mgnify:CR=1 FL=1